MCDRFWTTVDAQRGTRLPPLSLAVVRYAELGDTGESAFKIPAHLVAECVQLQAYAFDPASLGMQGEGLAREPGEADAQEAAA